MMTEPKRVGASLAFGTGNEPSITEAMRDGFCFERVTRALRRRSTEWAIVVVLVGLLTLLPRGTLAEPPAKGLAVATEAPRAAQEAMAVLKKGGNAVDAAVVTALVAGVVSSSSSGIGGGGFVNYFDAKSGQITILDFREVAPMGIDEGEFERRPFDSTERGKTTGVPGEVRGLYELHRRFGKTPWQELVSVAARVAKQGFAVNAHMSGALASQRATLGADPGLSSLWMPNGKLASPGQWIVNPRLAKTLQAIAEQGPAAFYDGPVAAEIVNTARRYGSAMTLDDLSGYRVKERQPLSIEWEGVTVHTMPPPSAGGFMLAQTLKLYKAQDLVSLGFNSPAYVHALAEAFRAAFADRMRYFGDPDHVKVDVKMLLGDERMRRRRARIALDRTHALPRFGLEEHGTHHLVTRDAAGNVVSLTTTVNTGFGADIMTEQSGIVLNDELSDFSKNAWVRAFGLSQSLNRARPGARPVSSMMPTIVVKDGVAVLAAGGSGGMNIGPDVSQTVVHQLVFGASPRRVVTAPRFQVPLFGASIRVPTKLGSKAVAELERRGEVATTFERTYTAVQMLRVKNGVVSAAADPQKHGMALVE